jgi:hypothetical protein
VPPRLLPELHTLTYWLFVNKRPLIEGIWLDSATGLTSWPINDKLYAGKTEMLFIFTLEFDLFQNDLLAEFFLGTAYSANTAALPVMLNGAKIFYQHKGLPMGPI